MSLNNLSITTRYDIFSGQSIANCPVIPRECIKSVYNFLPDFKKGKKLTKNTAMTIDPNLAKLTILGLLFSKQ